MQIRPATPMEQAEIGKMVRAAQLNPFNVRWENFRVAVQDGCIVGIGQLRPHSDGSRELASLAVAPEFRGYGIGRQIVNALMAEQRPPIYLFCEDELERYYARFGFRLIDNPNTLPAPLARLFRAGSVVKRIDVLLGRSKARLIGMKWDGSTGS
ncbi:MAG: GNAT family N-acetyltransferase [Chloroflexi bacterium]|nr:GNAT family N-acetyltransferase [Chloroflexota bacterium]MCL5274541.1 GNAT family N-acetyltransferase [Chloroflexota bacterium]